MCRNCLQSLTDSSFLPHSVLLPLLGYPLLHVPRLQHPDQYRLHDNLPDTRDRFRASGRCKLAARQRECQFGKQTECRKLHTHFFLCLQTNSQTNLLASQFPRPLELSISCRSYSAGTFSSCNCWPASTSRIHFRSATPATWSRGRVKRMARMSKGPRTKGWPAFKIRF